MKEDDEEEGSFKKLKNIENAQKTLFSGNNDDDDDDDDDDDESIYCTSESEFDDKNKMGSKPLNVFHYLKSLSQKAKDLMDEIEDASSDTDDYKLLFIGSNR